MATTLTSEDQFLATGDARHYFGRPTILPRIDADAVAQALDFDLVQVPSTFTDPLTGEALPTGQSSVVRVGGTRSDGQPLTTKALGNMSPAYRPNQYRDYFVQVTEALEREGAKVDMLATLGGGAKAMLAVSLPDGIGTVNVEGAETGLVRTVFGDSADGSARTRAALSFLRIACTNQFNTSLFGNGALWAISHTSSAEKRISEAVRTMHKSVEATKEVGGQIEALITTTFTEGQFRDMLKVILGDKPEEEGAKLTRWTNRHMAIERQYFAPNLSAVRSTKWGALQAVQAYGQHDMHVRGAKGNENRAKAGRSLAQIGFGANPDKLAEAAARYLSMN